MCWLRDQAMAPVFIAPGTPRQSDLDQNVNGSLRDECLSREWFRDLREARIPIERRRLICNHERPKAVLGYRTPAAV
jgi:transposase InsO family protein